MSTPVSLHVSVYLGAPANRFRCQASSSPLLSLTFQLFRRHLYADVLLSRIRGHVSFLPTPFLSFFSFPGLLGELIQQSLQSLVGFDAWHAQPRHPSSPYVCTSIKSELLECEPARAPASQQFPSNCQALGPVHTVSLLPSYVGVLIAIWKLFWNEDHVWLGARYSPANTCKIRR